MAEKNQRLAMQYEKRVNFAANSLIENPDQDLGELHLNTMLPLQGEDDAAEREKKNYKALKEMRVAQLKGYAGRGNPEDIEKVKELLASDDIKESLSKEAYSRYSDAVKEQEISAVKFKPSSLAPFVLQAKRGELIPMSKYMVQYGASLPGEMGAALMAAGEDLRVFAAQQAANPGPITAQQIAKVNRHFNKTNPDHVKAANKTADAMRAFSNAGKKDPNYVYEVTHSKKELNMLSDDGKLQTTGRLISNTEAVAEFGKMSEALISGDLAGYLNEVQRSKKQNTGVFLEEVFSAEGLGIDKNMKTKMRAPIFMPQLQNVVGINQIMDSPIPSKNYYFHEPDNLRQIKGSVNKETYESARVGLATVALAEARAEVTTEGKDFVTIEDEIQQKFRKKMQEKSKTLVARFSLDGSPATKVFGGMSETGQRQPILIDSSIAAGHPERINNINALGGMVKDPKQLLSRNIPIDETFKNMIRNGIPTFFKHENNIISLHLRHPDGYDLDVPYTDGSLVTSSIGGALMYGPRSFERTFKEPINSVQGTLSKEAQFVASKQKGKQFITHVRDIAADPKSFDTIGDVF